jgi:hypothetical protein
MGTMAATGGRVVRIGGLWLAATGCASPVSSAAVPPPVASASGTRAESAAAGSPRNMLELPPARPEHVVSVSVRQSYCAAYRSGALRCWGNVPPWEGEPQTVASEPVAMAEVTDALAVTAGDNGFYLLRRDHTVVELFPHKLAVVAEGIRAVGSKAAAVALDGSVHLELGGSKLPGVHHAIAAAGGEYHVCAVLSSGRVVCFGSNGYGQLGVAAEAGQSTADMPTSGPPEPVVVPNVEHVREVSAGAEHSCALHDDGTVSCWGSGYQGNVGRRVDEGRHAAARVPGVHDAVAIASDPDGWTTCVVHRTGSVSCWGSSVINDYTRPTKQALDNAMEVGPVRFTRIQGARGVVLAADLCVWGGPTVWCGDEVITGDGDYTPLAP